jgi:hypothetical protein
MFPRRPASTNGSPGEFSPGKKVGLSRVTMGSRQAESLIHVKSECQAESLTYGKSVRLKA